MKKTIRKYIAAALVLTLALLCSGCIIDNTEPERTPYPWQKFESEEYGDFSRGLSSFTDNYSVLYSTAMEKLDKNIKDGKVKIECEDQLYDNFRIVLSMAQMEIMNLYEYDMLPTTEKYFDRAEGTLYSTDYYGYKIKQTAGIKFGCDTDATTGKYLQSGTLDSYEKYLYLASTEKISSTLDNRVMTEISLFGDHEYAMRYVVSVVDSEKQSITTKIIYALLKNDTFEIAYYEGNASISKVIKLNDLVDYNIEAMMFGVGCNVSFRTEL